MRDLGSVLSFAISEEEAAAAFYTSLAGQVSGAAMKELLLRFAREEEQHKRKLLEIQRAERPAVFERAGRDLKIADYLVDIQPTPDISYQDALIVAMKKEKAAYRMYMDMADSAQDDAMRRLFESLANEEANHKLRFEVEYDEQVLTEN